MPYDSSLAPLAVVPQGDPRLAKELSEIAGEILVPFGAVDTELLAVGDRLGAASGILARLTALFEALPVTLESDDLREATGHLDDITREALRMAETLTQEGVALDHLETLSGEVSTRIDGLRRTVGAISVLSINARIAATQVNARGEDFSVYTAEIGRLAKAAKETIERFATEHDQLAGALAAARTNTADFERTHKPTLLAVADSLETALLSVSSHRAQSKASALDIGSRSRRIAEGIATVIQALQIGDITRQRVEHVTRALEALAAGLSPRPGKDDAWCASLPAEQKDSVVAVVCRLQAAQLAQAGNDFTTETGRTATALSGLATEAQAILRTGANLYGSKNGRSDSFLVSLAQELRQADALIRETQKARQDVDRIAAAITDALNGLLAQVSAVTRIEVDMRLVGLNTTLRCGRLGDEGRTLTVIAQELRSYANQTVDDAQAVMEGLRRVVAAAASLNVNDSERGAARIAAFERKTAAAITTLEEVGISLSSALALLGSEGDRAAQLLRMPPIAQELVGRTMRDGQNRLDRIASAFPATERDLKLVKEHVTSLLKEHYTMESERALHAVFNEPEVASRTAPANAATIPRPASTTDTLDDIFF